MLYRCPLSPHTGPHRNVDRLLVLHRQLDRPDLGLMGLLGGAETAVRQPQNPGGYQHDCRNLDCIPVSLKLRDTA